MGPASLFYITMTYIFPFANVAENAPVWSIDIIPLRSANFTTGTCTMWSLLFFFQGGRYSSDGSFVYLFSSILSSVVTIFLSNILSHFLHMSHVVWMVFGMCQWIPSAIKSGNVLNKLLLMARNRVDITGPPSNAW